MKPNFDHFDQAFSDGDSATDPGTTAGNGTAQSETPPPRPPLSFRTPEEICAWEFDDSDIVLDDDDALSFEVQAAVRNDGLHQRIVLRRRQVDQALHNCVEVVVQGVDVVHQRQFADIAKIGKSDTDTLGVRDLRRLLQGLAE